MTLQGKNVTIEEIIAQALRGRTQNSAATEWGVQQVTLNNYARGVRVPDYQTAILLASEARIGLAEVMKACAIKEAELKPHSWFVTKFVTPGKQLINGKWQEVPGGLYVMLNGMSKLLRRASDAVTTRNPTSQTR